MELYDVKTRGLHSPLNSREIAALSRAGSLLGQAPCKPVGESRWRTVDDLFPLLKYGAGTLSSMQVPQRGPGAAPVILAVGFVALILGALVVFPWNPRTHPKPPRNVATSQAPARLPVVARFTTAPGAAHHGVAPASDIANLAAR